MSLLSAAAGAADAQTSIPRTARQTILLTIEAPFGKKVTDPDREKIRRYAVILAKGAVCFKF
jgi:hypothetical protein